MKRNKLVAILLVFAIIQTCAIALCMPTVAAYSAEDSNTYSTATKAGSSYIKYESRYHIQGSFDDWDVGYVLGNNGDGTVSTVVRLSAGTYEFKIYNSYTTEYYGNSGTINLSEGTCQNWGFRIKDKNTGVDTPNAKWIAQTGFYKITVDVSNRDRFGVTIVRTSSIADYGWYLEGTNNITRELFATDTEGVASCRATLNAGGYYFRIANVTSTGTVYYGNHGVFTDDTIGTYAYTYKESVGDKYSMLETIGGVYRFTIDTRQENPTVKIEYLYEANPGELITVYFVPMYYDSGYHEFYSWDAAYVYPMDSNTQGIGTAYPGEKMSYLSEIGKYVAQIPKNTEMIKFSDGTSANKRTENLSINASSAHNTIFYLDNYLSDNKWSVRRGDKYTPSPDFTCYTVVFTDYDDTILDVQSIARGYDAVAPEVPDREGYIFTGWSKSFDKITSDCTIQAMYEKTAPTSTLKVEVAGGTGFTISINDSTGVPQGSFYSNDKIPLGATVTVTANDTSDAKFMGWYNGQNYMIISKDQSYTFTASGNNFIKAVYSTPVEGVQLVTFKHDKIGKFGRVLDTQYYSSPDEIAFPEDPTSVGYDFAGWSMTEAEIQAALAKGEDVEVVTTWTRQIVYVDVTVQGGTGTGTYIANAGITVTAGEAPEGEKFAYWTDANGKIRSYSTDYKFYPTEDTTVTAVFVPEDEEIVEKILVSVDTIDTVSVAAKNQFYFSWYVPEDYDLVKVGILGVNKDNYNEETFYTGTTDSNVYDRGPSGTAAYSGTSVWAKSNVTVGQTWVAKAYVQYRDANGNIQTVYSDLTEATKA